MRSFVFWSDKIVDKESVKQPVYDLAFKPDGSELLVACGSVILVYNAQTGQLLNTLRAHKESVFCLDYCPDEKRFASGSADKTVIIWSSKYEPILKYTHADSIQHISHNPVSFQTTTCSSSEYGLWSPEQKSVNKYKISGRINCCSWTNDGKFLALGLFNGHVSIRNRSGEEMVRIVRSAAPVWSLQWSPAKDCDVLAVADWNQKLSFYSLNGKQLGAEKALSFDPCFVEYFGSDMMFIGGSDKKVSLWTSQGIRLGIIGERDSWIWCCRVRPKHNFIAVGSDDGSVTMYQLTFTIVHGLYQDHYAYRDNMTKVIVKNLSNQSSFGIECSNYVKKVAIYKGRLAIHLPDVISIYETNSMELLDYQLKGKINKKFECNLLVITSNNIILCHDKRLHMINLKGETEREWLLESLVRYIKVIGGPSGKEGLLVGLKSGEVMLLYIHNHFPIHLVTLNSAVRCLDLSKHRTKLAAVDDQGNCHVYEMRTKKLLFTENNASSVAWNTEYEDLLCYSGNGRLSIKSGSLPTTSQKLSGFVVGFKGSKIFSLNSNNMVTIEIPQSASMNLYLQQGQISKAYDIACLGVTDFDWKRLGMETLRLRNFDYSRKAFTKVKDIKYLELLKLINNLSQKNIRNPDVQLAYIFAFDNKFSEAASLFKSSGYGNLAVDMYTDLNMWDHAAAIADETSTNKFEILKKKAKTQNEKNDPLAAAKVYVDIGDFMQAFTLYSQHYAIEPMMTMARKVSKSEIKLICKCIDFFRKHTKIEYCCELYQKIGFIHELVDLYLENSLWQEAFRLADSYPEHKETIHFRYAKHLLESGEIENACKHFKLAGRSDLVLENVERLQQQAATENRYTDAAFLSYKISLEYLELFSQKQSQLKSQHEIEIALQTHYEYEALAEIYHAFDPVYQFLFQPFTEYFIEHLFQMARFVYLSLQRLRKPPVGIQTALVYLALGRLATHVGAHQVARTAFEKLRHNSIIPISLKRQYLIGALKSKAHPELNNEELQPICWNCGNINELIIASNTNSEKIGTLRESCSSCKSKATPCMYSFESLPIVEVQTAEEADDLLTIHSRLPEIIPNKYYRLAVPDANVLVSQCCQKHFHAEDFEMIVARRENRCPFCNTRQINLGFNNEEEDDSVAPWI